MTLLCASQRVLTNALALPLIELWDSPVVQVEDQSKQLEKMTTCLSLLSN